MAIEAYERQSQREISVRSGSISARRVYHIIGARDEQQVFTQFGRNPVPNYGDQHPVFPNLYARENTCRIVEGHNDVWELEWQYTPYPIEGIPTNPAAPDTPETPGFLRYSATTAAQFELAWRRDADLTKVGIARGQDIGGTGIDCMGNPTSVLRAQMNFQVSVTETFGKVRWNTIRDYIGSRNKNNFLGLPAEFCVYMGANAQRMSPDTIAVTHNFLYDEFKHLKQVPWRDELGNLEPGQLAGPIAIVNHIQPFPRKEAFGDLSRFF